MTLAELRYLIATSGLDDGKNGVKLTDIAEMVGVTKVSVYRAIERLEKSEYIKRNEKNKVVMTEKGKTTLAEYMVTVNFLRKHLEERCGTPGEVAYHDALGAACAISDISRRKIAEFTEREETTNITKRGEDHD